MITVLAILAVLVLVALFVWLTSAPGYMTVQHPERFHVGMRITAGGRAFVITRIDGNVIEWKPQ
jgi:hypothetical protein